MYKYTIITDRGAASLDAIDGNPPMIMVPFEVRRTQDWYG